jgi:hypothetical protein
VGSTVLFVSHIRLSHLLATTFYFYFALLTDLTKSSVPLRAMSRPTSPEEHQSRPRRPAADNSDGGAFMTATDMSDQKRNSILQMVGDIEKSALSSIDEVSEDAIARKMLKEKEEHTLRQQEAEVALAAHTKKKVRGRRSSVRRGSVGRAMGLSKHHVQVWNKQFDRDEPPPMIMRALAATGNINLKELSEVEGSDLLGYPEGNDPGDTRSFMLLLS